jgi:hypothetical protein
VGHDLARVRDVDEIGVHARSGDRLVCVGLDAPARADDRREDDRRWLADRNLAVARRCGMIRA